MNRPRKPVYDADAAALFLIKIRAGNYVTTALHLSGMSRGTLDRWLDAAAEYAEAEAQGHRPNADYAVFRDFRRDLVKAAAEAEDRLLADVRNQGERDWKAAAWIMERRFGKRWAKKAEIGERTPEQTSKAIKSAQRKANSDAGVAGDVERLAKSLSGKLGA